MSPRTLLLTAAALLAAAVPAHAVTAPRPKPTPAPTFSHVVEVFLENEEASKTFEKGGPPELQAVAKQGLYFPNFFGIGHASLDNYEAAFAGVAPTAAGTSDCLGQPWGTCVFPASVPTIADRLDRAHLPWRVYAEGMNGAPNGGPCLHAPSRQAPDPYQGPLTNGYAGRHNPAIWFDSVLTRGGSEDYCKAHDDDLTELWKDADSGHLPAYSFVEPDTCHDGHDTSSLGGCALDPEGPSAPNGTAAMAAWLPDFVHRLTTSKAWDARSVLLITFDESESSDTAGCASCKDGSAGGRIGMVVISPMVTPGSVNSTWEGDHYSVLRSLEETWHLRPLDHDGLATVTALPIKKQAH